MNVPAEIQASSRPVPGASLPADSEQITCKSDVVGVCLCDLMPMLLLLLSVLLFSRFLLSPHQEHLHVDRAISGESTHAAPRARCLDPQAAITLSRTVLFGDSLFPSIGGNRRVVTQGLRWTFRLFIGRERGDRNILAKDRRSSNHIHEGESSEAHALDSSDYRGNSDGGAKKASVGL